MKSTAVFVVATLSAVAGGVIGFELASARPGTPEEARPRAASLEPGVERLIDGLARVEALLPELERLARPASPSSDSGARAAGGVREGGEALREPVASDADETTQREIHEIRDQIARLAEQLARSRSPTADADRMRESFAKARPADWDALTEYGKRWRDPELGAAARQEVLFLDQGELLARFGKPNKVSLQTPSGMLWKYDRDRTSLALGDVYEVKFDLSSDGFVVNPWDVNVVEPPERRK